MKVKTIVITLLVTAAAATGIVYGVRSTMKPKNTVVKVVPVANVNNGFYGDFSVQYGNVFSKSTQNVQLNSDYELVKVFVKQGEQVKKGDPLLEYDMVLPELQREMESLTKQTLEINLEEQQKELDKLKKTTPTASVSANDDSDLTGAAAEQDSQFGGEEPTVDTGTTDGGGDNSEGDLIGEDGGQEGGTDVPPGETGTGDGSGGDDLIIDENPENPEAETEGDLLIGDDGALDNVPDLGEAGDAQTILQNTNAFLTRVNQLSSQPLDQLIYSDITEALRIYRETLSYASDEEFTDILNENRLRLNYKLHPAVREQVGDTSAEILEQAYDRVCVYDFIYQMQQLNPDKVPAADITDEMTALAEANLRKAIEIYYNMRDSALKNEAYTETLRPYIEELGAWVVHLNRTGTIEETETSSEEMTEPDTGDYGDYGDMGGYDDSEDVSYTAEELKAAIRDQEATISETKLQIRESELKLKQFDRTLDAKIVKATMDGVVVSAGTVQDSVSDEDFIVISGKVGMYMKGAVSELKLDSIHVGDMLSGTSYETGVGFTAEVTDISLFPTTDMELIGYNENSNESYYPFEAYIENSDGLEEGSVEYSFTQTGVNSGIYLEKYFIRTGSDGKSYVYIAGSDGLLKKQNVVTGATIYNSATEIISGLSLNDKIAFPYGDGVQEGAETQEVDTLLDYSAWG